MGKWTEQNAIKARWLVRQTLQAVSPAAPTRAAQAEVLKERLNRFLEENSEDVYIVFLIPHYFELASVLMEDSQREKELFAKLFQESVIHYYELFAPWIRDQQAAIDKRERRATPGLYEGFRQLYEFCKNRRERNGQ